MRILWTEPAIEDLKSIRDCIARDSQAYAVSFVEGVLSAVDRLEAFPQLGRIVPESDTPEIRELIFYSYRIIYHIAGEQSEILAVIHGSRDLSTGACRPWEIQ